MIEELTKLIKKKSKTTKSQRFKTEIKTNKNNMAVIKLEKLSF